MFLIQFVISLYLIWIIIGIMYNFFIYPYLLKNRHKIVWDIKYTSIKYKIYSYKADIYNVMFWPTGVFLHGYLTCLFENKKTRKKYIKRLQEDIDKSVNVNGIIIDLAVQEKK